VIEGTWYDCHKAKILHFTFKLIAISCQLFQSEFPLASPPMHVVVLVSRISRSSHPLSAARTISRPHQPPLDWH